MRHVTSLGLVEGQPVLETRAIAQKTVQLSSRNLLGSARAIRRPSLGILRAALVDENSQLYFSKKGRNSTCDRYAVR